PFTVKLMEKGIRRLQSVQLSKRARAKASTRATTRASPRAPVRRAGYTEASSVFQEDQTGRKPRADSIRNRERLLKAAARVFSAGGAAAGLEAVSRQAGLGIGTLYRHFSTREALFEAVYRREVDALGAHAERLARELPPGDALRQALHAGVRLVATKKGM